jgi:TRAP transporter TAXI family solute receptor
MVCRKAALALSVVVVLGGCRAEPSVGAAAGRPELRISMRPTEILSAFLSLPQFSAQAVAIGDSEKRLQALQEGKIDVTNAVADVTYLAFNGRLPSHAPPMQKLRGVALMNRAVIHVLVGPGVDPRRGFRGMRIVLGDPTSGNAALGERLVNSAGVPTTDIHGEFAPYDVAVDRLLNGNVDAAILTLMPPQEPVARAFRGGARLKEVDGPEVDGLRVHYPLLRRTLLPAGTYPGQDTALHTVGVDLMLVCRADLSNDIAYALTRALFEEVPRRIRQQLDPQRAPATVIPLHPGAARYYRERELSR